MFGTVVNIGGTNHVKNIPIGKGLPVVIQTMSKDRLTRSDIIGDAGKAFIKRIENLESLGCGILRFAVPDIETAEILGELSQKIVMPIVADIHFDYKIALRCLDFPIAKIRINPGNIGSAEKTSSVLKKCASKNVPVRIGINAGSLPADIRDALEKNKISRPQALVATAERELELFERHNFGNIVVSMKAASVSDTIEANTLFAKRYDIPLHIGVTEAGPLIAGVARSSAALYTLLKNDIGDTVRVSLSDSMENEVIAAKEILLTANKTCGVRIISCPRCGRCGFDTHEFTSKWSGKLYTLDKNITVAVMGCAVNGPGEAKNADIGISGCGNKIVIFKHGKIIHTIGRNEADNIFMKELERL